MLGQSTNQDPLGDRGQNPRHHPGDEMRKQFPAVVTAGCASFTRFDRLYLVELVLAL